MTDDRTDKDEPPRLQDTSEREALPVPLPESGSGQDPAVAWTPPNEGGDAPTGEVPAPVEESAAADEPAPLEESGPADEPARDAATAASGNGDEPSPYTPPPFEPARSVADIGAQDEGLPTEVLVGAAFLGGLALAFLIKRLGS